MTGQLALFDTPAVRGKAPRRTYEGHTTDLGLPRLGDRRAAARLDPHGDRGLETGNADVIVRGWGRPVADVPLALAGRL